MTVWIAAAVVIFIALPLIAFRGRTLLLYARFDVVTYLMAWLMYRQFPTIDPYLGFTTVGVAKLCVFSIFLANGEQVRWSANRAAIIGLLVYLLVGRAMLRVPIDGDEPYYLLISESILRDGDVDLANQYRHLDRFAPHRSDLRPQIGDPTGPRGQQYSRHEPFLSLLLIPGYLAAGLPGAVATVILFAVFLLRSTIRFFEEEGIPERTARAVFPFVAFGPPIIFYAARIWPEVPAAFLLVEAIRGVRNQRRARWIASLFLLTLLKLRFLLIAAPLLYRAIGPRKASGPRPQASGDLHLSRFAWFSWGLRPGAWGLLPSIAAAIIAVPLLIVWIISGSATNVHSIRDALPLDPMRYLIGFFGLLLDGMGGLLFQAPFYLLGVIAIASWRAMPDGFRLGVFGSSLYLFFLVPRSEWHGGWSPPLRYIVFLMPVLALGAAALWQRWSPALISIIAVWTAGVVIHGVAYPWRLFHIASGESAAGEWLSRIYRSDFSRLFPSYIRPNFAAIVGAIALIVVLVLCSRGHSRPRTAPGAGAATLASIALAAAFIVGRQPAHRVDFEDAHVIHRGGQLFPDRYIVSRFLYRGGWLVRAGDSLSFLIRRGSHRLEYAAPVPSTIEIAGHAYHLDATGAGYASKVIAIENSGRVELRCLSGSVNLDRIE